MIFRYSGHVKRLALGKITLLFFGAVVSVAAAAQQSSPNPIPRIANGLETFDWPAVVALVTPPPPGVGSYAQSVCTGTLIGCRTVLTAGHCVCSDEDTTPGCQGPSSPGDLAVYSQHGGAVAVSSIEIAPNYNFGNTGDVALLRLEQPMTGVTPMAINASAKPSFGTTGILVGFGLARDDKTDKGVKREGNVEIGSCDGAGVPNSEHVCWSFGPPFGAPGTDSNTCPGDSGGPLFVEGSSGPVVAGVTSGGINNCHVSDVAFDADVFTNRDWIEDTAGADLGTANCGALPVVGSDEVTVVTGSESLTVKSPQFSYTVEVAADAALLRVTLNGDESILTGNNFNDFDLWVKRGSRPSNPDDADCAPLGFGNIEQCEFDDPAAGTWHVVVNMFSTPTFNGVGGTVQSTATVFGVDGGGGGEDVIHSDGYESQ